MPKNRLALRSPSRARLLAVLGALSLTAAACGGTDDVTVSDAGSTGDTAVASVDEEAVAPSSSEAETAEEPAEASADSSLLFGEFATLSGSSVNLDALQGEDVVLWFWAPW